MMPNSSNNEAAAAAVPIPNVISSKADPSLVDWTNDQLDYMPTSYDCSNLQFLEVTRNSFKRRMRIGNSSRSARNSRRRSYGESGTSQMSDDDDECQGSGGICPSCRLAVNKDTGRLKWCMGGNDIWRTRIRFMLLIPAVILPITIIIIALSKSTVIGKLSMRSSHAQRTAPDNGLEDNVDTPTASLHSDGRLALSGLKNDIEQSEVAKRALHPDVETSFLPAESVIASGSFQRDKKDMSKRDIKSASEAAAAAAATATWRRWRREAIDAVTSKGQAVEAAHSEAKALKALRGDGGLLQELQVNFSRSSGTQQQQQQQPRGVNKRDSRSSKSLSRGQVKPCDDSDDVSNCDSDEDDEEESQDEVEDEAEEEEDKDDELDDISSSSRSSSSELIGRIRTFHEARLKRKFNVENDAGKMLFGDNGDWSEEFIRKSQAEMMLKYMDKTADPCKDFYQFACGSWEKYNPIPDDKVGIDTFENLRESLNYVLKQLLEEPEIRQVYNSSSAIIKAKNFYRSCMNYEILESRGERPLLELLDKLGGWPILQPDWNPDTFDWITLMSQLRLYNNAILISEWVGPDTENSDEYIIQLGPSNLGLPTKDYFTKAVNTIYLMAYKNYLISIAHLLGATLRNARTQAKELIQFEIQLANITTSEYERRNRSVEQHRRMTLDELQSSIPQIDWHRYLSIILERPVKYNEPVVLYEMNYFKDLVELLSRTPPRIVANYLIWRFVRHRVINLDDRFHEAKQTFYYVLLGREKSPPRWKICVEQINAYMSMAVGSMFVRKYFDEKSKNDTLAMTHEIQRAFRELLNQSRWLDPTTKQEAREKVDAMLLRIGYPNFILRLDELDLSYKDVNIRSDRYFENTLTMLNRFTRNEHNQLRYPVKKSQSNVPPAIVNAYYNRNKNQIVVPAGILQPPFYHKYFPRSLNYGGIGVVIGHEITHGFDDIGRLFDKNGNLHRWWSTDSIEEFNQRAFCLIDQYSHYIVNEVSMPIDGTTTQGENIADNGGIKQAFRAYEKWLSENDNANENLPGVEATGPQLFFLNFAQVWCSSMRPEAMRNKLKTTVHSPGRYRVIGTLSNFEDFAKVFNCPLGSPMNPLKKCLVW